MDNPTYYAILPANVRYDKNLKPMEKIMYSEITALTNMNGDCTAGNRYFANLYDVSIGTVSKWVGRLKKFGYVTLEVTYNEDKTVDKRIISITDGRKGTLSQKEQGGMVKKNQGGMVEKDKDNINTTYVNNINPTDSNKRESTSHPPNKKFALAEYHYKGLVEVWKAFPKLIQPRALNDDLKKAVDKLIKEDYPVGDIYEGIRLYGTILSDDKYFWHWRWNIVTYLNRKNGFREFVGKEPNDFLVNNFNKGSSNGHPDRAAAKPPQTPIGPPSVDPNKKKEYYTPTEEQLATQQSNFSEWIRKDGQADQSAKEEK